MPQGDTSAAGDDAMAGGLNDEQKALLADKVALSILRYVKGMHEQGHRNVYLHQIARLADLENREQQSRLVEAKLYTRKLLDARLLYSDMGANERNKFLNNEKDAYRKSDMSVKILRGPGGLADAAYSELEKLLFS
jgi:hypothetical protein